MSKDGSGRIITFYSYKGGTGRSMALANVAWILASNGKRVLAVDWDLEAPGLHRYFSPFLVDKDLTSSDGVINWVTDYKLKAMTPPAEGEKRFDDWYLPYTNILHYACALKWDFKVDGNPPLEGKLDFVPAGRQDGYYSSSVNSFDWQQFYGLLGGAKFLEAAKRHMKQNYDYILIDSRTGVSDTSGICTIQLPDDLVICYTLNNQSIRGAAAVAATAAAQRGETLRVFPVPMRVDPFEQKKLELRTELAKEMFGSFPAHLLGPARESYRAKVQIPYIPYYAYEEVLATFGDTVPPRSGSLLESLERVSHDLTGEDLNALRVREGDRRRILADFEGSTDRELIGRAEKVFDQFSPDERETARRIFTRLVRVAPPHDGRETAKRIFTRLVQVAPPRDEPTALGASRVFSLPSVDAEDKPARFSLEEFGAPAQKVVKTLADAGVVVIQHEEVRLSKDSMVRSWPRLREWIDGDRDFLAWRQDVCKVAPDWRAAPDTTLSNRDKGLLLSGSKLSTAEHWLSRRRSDLLAIEIEYIEESRRRRKVVQRAVGAVAAAASIVLALAIGYGSAERSWKQESRGQAVSTAGSPTLAIRPIRENRFLLAQSSSEFRLWDPKAEAALFSGSGGVESNASGDYLLITTGGTSGSVDLLETATGKKHSIPLRPDEDATFDESGRFVVTFPMVWDAMPGTQRRNVSANSAGLISVWSMPEGQLAGRVKAGLYSSEHNYVTEKGDRLITEDDHGAISLWDLRNGALISLLNKAGESDRLLFNVIESKAVIAITSAPSLSLASLTSVWSLNTGSFLGGRANNPLSLYELYARAVRNNGLLFMTKFSQDGSFLLLGQNSSTGSIGRGEAGIISTTGANPVAPCPQVAPTVSIGAREFVVCSGNSADVALWDGNTPQPKVMKGFSLSTIGEAYINQDSSRLLVIRKTAQAELWNFATGQKLRDLDVIYKGASADQATDRNASFASFTLDGRAVSVRLEGGAIMLYRADNGARIGVLENAVGTKQEVYYDDACHRANVWTDTGGVLRYTEGRTFLNWFVPTARCAN